MRRAAATPRRAWPTWPRMRSRRRWCVAALSLHAVAVAVPAGAGRTAPAGAARLLALRLFELNWLKWHRPPPAPAHSLHRLAHTPLPAPPLRR